MSDLKNGTYQHVKTTLSRAIQQIFSTDRTNFLALTTLSDLEVIRGDNNLDTCFQYVIQDDDGRKLMVVKLYDKLLDLMTRDGTQLVGSRMATILGSKQYLSLFEKRIRKA